MHYRSGFSLGSLILRGLCAVAVATSSVVPAAMAAAPAAKAPAAKATAPADAFAPLRQQFLAAGKPVASKNTNKRALAAKTSLRAGAKRSVSNTKPVKAKRVAASELKLRNQIKALPASEQEKALQAYNASQLRKKSVRVKDVLSGKVQARAPKSVVRLKGMKAQKQVKQRQGTALQAMQPQPPRKKIQSYYYPSSVSAGFYASSDFVTEGDTVSFYDDSEAYGEDYWGDWNYVEDWYWDLDGDGHTDSNSRNPSYTYIYPGDYYVTLTVVDSDGNEDSAGLWITVDRYYEPSDVYSGFLASSGYVSVGEDIAFTSDSYATGYTSSRYLNYVVSERWDFGDGDWDTGKYVYHDYDYPGQYLVTLTVRDLDGNTSVSSRYIEVINDSYPVSDFEVSSASIYAGTQVTFSSSSYQSGVGGRIERLEWNFGDGDTDTSYYERATVYHTYNTPGTYHATLKVFDNYGNQSSSYVDIVVYQNATPFSISNVVSTGPVTGRTLTANINVATADVGSNGAIFVLALLPNGDWYMNTGGPFAWQQYPNFLTPPPAYLVGQLPATRPISLISGLNVSGIVGTQVFIGYGKGPTVAAAWANLLLSSQPLQYQHVKTIQVAP